MSPPSPQPPGAPRSLWPIIAPVLPSTSADVRAHLTDALHADLVGPFDLDPASTEVLPRPPSRFYLTGFLAPSGDRDPGDPTDDEEYATGSDADDEEQSESAPEPKVRKLFPASIGLSVLLPPGHGDAVQITLHYAEYYPAPADETPDDRKRPPEHWQRLGRRPVVRTVALDSDSLARGEEVPGTDGLWLEGRLSVADAPGLAPGTRALSLFVVNHRTPVLEPGKADLAFVFQVSLEVRYAAGIVPRPNRRDEASDDLDDRMADLQYRAQVEWAVGHGVSTEALVDGAGRVVGARTVWLPRAEVRPVVSQEVAGVSAEMEALAAMPDGAALRSALGPLLDAYAVWITQQRAVPLDSVRRAETRDLLMDDAERARGRIAEGLDLLATRDDLFVAFTLANRAMALQARKRDPARYAHAAPRWRLFQLAFLLLNIAGLDDPRHPDRACVELIFFPTGGGKTEAYLGVIAFALVLRRMRGRERPDGGYGVTVLLRYTLRLLTLDQLQRAATLVCALETLRREAPEGLGAVRFSVGLWVGRTATANTLAEVSEKITTWKTQRDNKKAPSPLPLTHCPWCGFVLDPDTATLQPSKSDPTHVRILCKNFRDCDFGQGNKLHADEGLPLVFVDEQVYRELPSFLVATVDKFAMVPWRAEAGMLFGRVHSRLGRQFFGTPDSPGPTRAAEVLPEGLRPPELIVQDELHLISGPLGTMVGLYETAIEALCTTSPRAAAQPLSINGEGLVRADALDASARGGLDATASGSPLAIHGEGGWGGEVRPKLLASTATVRRARRQILSLFGRDRVALFPPPGLNEGETFFARVDHAADGRAYLSVAAGGRAMKAVLLRVYVALLAGAWRRVGAPTDNDPADPYSTLVGYFNALRELGGMRRLVEDEVRSRCARIDEHRPVGEKGTPRWFRVRELGEPVELTSRESTHSIARTRARLKDPLTHDEHVDVLLASNMISVGVDIDRLGLMVVAGQPKTTSEYIQATSRVGRDSARPGLVVTVLNLHKPRDRSHFERFAAYHGCFYRHVEAMSLTPFSAPALERGFAGALLAMARHADGGLQPAAAVMDVEVHRAAIDGAIEALATRAGRERLGLDAQGHEALVETLRQRGRSLVDSWVALVRASREGAGTRCWSPYDKERKGKPMLFTVLDPEAPPLGTDDARFAAPTSMRDVEATAHIWVERRSLSRKAVPS